MTVSIAAGVPAALAEACRQAGLSSTGARLLRSVANVVYHLPTEGVVVRLAEATTPGKLDRLVTSLKVTRWLHEQGFPVIRPLDVRQPIAAEGCLATFWYYEEGGPSGGAEHDPAPLGVLLRWLHALPSVPFALPTYDPFGGIRRAVHASLVIGDDERTWLLDRCAGLEETYYERLDFALPYGLIHGDAHRGNLIRTPERLLLCDWDSVSAGPREIDLVPTLQGVRFGLSEEQRSGFVRAYGGDIRRWPGYPVLRDIRELQTLTAVLRNAHRDPAAEEELRHRLASLRAGDDRTWHPV
ncbi:aminoglycoside phosphotransferase family protein [Microbispora sp. RL4-1S]|uniref:Aminoglycoside phosphotransferase family protein n=1 Tax=Microbispora oryzae TaxID=2806554 RepID=A0A941AL10_9ACTN|nr:aminoglycoside phosphotransferase family protein [Microbispora oryzae]MBP2706707.1 aminoglycoside phosphotransferase family protein [Microbispora oryzae]